MKPGAPKSYDEVKPKEVLPLIQKMIDVESNETCTYSHDHSRYQRDGTEDGGGLDEDNPNRQCLKSPVLLYDSRVRRDVVSR